MRKIREALHGILSVCTACVIVGLVLAVVVFGGAFLTIAGIVVGTAIVILLIAAGIYEWLTQPSSPNDS